jgi:aminoglycoside 6'-N-acetyltransferase
MTPGPDASFTELRTPRLVIRRFTLADAGAFSAYRSDPEVARYQSWDAPYDVEQAIAFISSLADPFTPGEWCQLAVTAGGVLIGDVALYIDTDPRLGRVGFTLARDAQGRGYATEAVRAVLDHAFGQGVHRIAADCDTRNERSIRLLERVGMRREGHLRASGWWKGEWTDEYLYAVLAEEWPTRRSAQSPVPGL